MDMQRRQALLWVLAAAATEAAADGQGYETVSWPALLPSGWNTQAVLDRLNLDRIGDGDPAASEAMRKVRELLDNAPPNRELDNRRLRLWGYMVPLEFAQRNVREFLLVPYFGACLHAPAPPANQVVHVRPATPVAPEVRRTGAVWVAGTLKVVRSDSDMGASCYSMTGAEVEPYKA